MNELNPFGGKTTEDNAEDRCLCVLVLDTSFSMNGDPINKLNNGLINFGEYLKKKNSTRYSVEVCIVSFNSTVNCVQEPALVDNLTNTSSFPLKAKGSTKLVDGVRLAIKKVDERKKYYKNKGLNYYRPWIVLMTDGYPDAGQNITALSQEIEEGQKNKKFAFLPMGVEGADETLLKKISTKEFPPIPIDWQKFDEVFKWLSNSFDSISNSNGKDSSFGSIEPFMSKTGWGGGSFDQSTI